MMFWFLLIGFFLMALLIILIPLSRYRDKDHQGSDGGKNIDVYKAQLHEVDADQQMGRLNETEAAAARLEIERRLLKITANQAPTQDNAGTSWPLIGLITALVLLFSMTFYLTIGRPGMPDFVFTDQDHSGTISVPGQAEKKPESPEIIQEVAKLEIHLQQNPSDIKAWRALGQYQGQLQNWPAAARAYQHWYERAPESIDAAVIYGESLIMMRQGRVGPAALLVLNKAQKMQPRNPGVRHYLALADYQAGNIDQALIGWKRLEAESKPGVPWLSQLRFWIRRAEKDLGIETANRGIPAISAEQRDAVAQMSEKEQMALIKSMVGRLQDRMDANQENIEGWLQLANAYRVLGQKQDAIKSLEQALAHIQVQTPEDLISQIKKQLAILRKSE